MRNCIFLLSLIILIASCGTEEKPVATNEVKFISYEDSLFTLSFPSTWINATDKYGNFNFAVVSPQDTKTDVVPENVTVLIQPISDTVTLESFQKQTEDELLRYLPDYIMINKDIRQENGLKYLNLEYLASQNNTKKRYLQHVYLRSKKVYVVTFIAEEIVYKEYANTAEEIMNSFEIKK